MNTKRKYTLQIKAEAKRLGFSACGISKAGFLEEEAPRLEAYLKKNFHGRMKYMENHFDKRLDPTKLVEGSKSVISLSFNYFTPDIQKDPEAPKLSRYAYGVDYHYVVKERLFQLFEYIQELVGEVSGRVFVDSAPVMERAWAERSGLGWVGKNGLLIQHKVGSFYFLGEIILDLELDEDKPIGDFCGTCTRCIDACPTQAIVAPKVINPTRCISYLTIELRDEIPDQFKSKTDNWMYGCDVCQTVCPWNRFSILHDVPEFQPHPDLLEMKKQDWIELKKETFNELFKSSAVNRAGYKKLKQTISTL